MQRLATPGVKDADSRWIGWFKQIYAMEIARAPSDVEFHLSDLDLLGEAFRSAAAAPEGADHAFLRLLVDHVGQLPAGALVWVAGAGVGRVMGNQSESSDPWRPRLLVGGKIRVPDKPVELVLDAAAR